MQLSKVYDNFRFKASQDAYAEIAPRQEATYEPLRSTKSSTSFYMAMKPFSTPNSTTLGCKSSGIRNGHCSISLASTNFLCIAG